MPPNIFQSQPESSLKAHSSNPKIKPILKQNVTWRCLVPSDITSINKYKPKMLSTLNIVDIKPELIETNSIKHLCRALTDAKKISSLRIHRNDWSQRTRKKLEHILNVTNHWEKLSFYFIDDEDEILSNDNFLRLKRCRQLSTLNVHFNCHESRKNRVLSLLSKQLRELPHLKTLNLDPSNCTEYDEEEEEEEDEGDYDPNVDILKLNYPQSLLSLNLKLQRHTVINPQLFAKFISNIECCHLLQDLNLNLSQTHNQEIPVSDGPIWEQFIQKTPNLKTLTLSTILYGNHLFKRNQHFLEEFHHVRNLTTLNLDLFFMPQAYPPQLLQNPMPESLASFKNLKSLTLRLTNFASIDFNPIISSLQYLPLLETLQLLTKDCTISNSNLQSLEQVLAHLKNLKILELILPSKDISPQGVNSLANALKQLSSIEILIIDLTKADLSYHSTEILAKSIAHLNLTSFSLTLGRPYSRTFLQKIASLWDDEQRLTHLFSAIYGFCSLTQLTLDLSPFYVCYKEFMHFSLALKELQQLKSLSLTLPKFESFRNYEGLRCLLTGIEALAKLTSLDLTFQGAGLCDKQVGFLASSLKNLKSLKALKLHFQKAKKLGNQTLKHLGLALQDLLSMRELVVSADLNNQFEMEEIVLFAEGFTNLKNLESLKLSLKAIALGSEFIISNRTFVNLRNHENFKNMKYLSINGVEYI